MAEATAQSKTKRKPRVATWTQDPERVRRNILASPRANSWKKA